MRVLVFAHVPPPLHGQSYMVQLMLKNVGNVPPEADQSLVLFHVDARLSDGLDDIGLWRIQKFFRLIYYIFLAWSMRWKHSLDTFYYVPAPPAKRGALYRDWLVLFFAASFFKVRIFHWHASGLGQWIREAATSGMVRRLEAWITQGLFHRHDLSCVLNEWGRRDVEVFSPRHVAIVPNGIPDPCPDRAPHILTERHRRQRQRSLGREESPAVFQLLYLAHATRTKGLFDAIEAVAQANARLAQNRAVYRIGLTVAGAFLTREEEEIFHERIQRDDLCLNAPGQESRAVIYAGHVEGEEKDRLLRESDALCFVSHYPNEGQPVSVIEALAYGMPVLLSRWRALPEMVPLPLAHLVSHNDPAMLSEALLVLAGEVRFEEYRKHYLTHYMLAVHVERLRAALRSVDPSQV